MALNIVQNLVFISIALFIFIWGEWLVKYFLKKQKWKKPIYKFTGFLVLVIAIGFLPNLLTKILYKLLSETGIIVISLATIFLSYLKFSKDY